MQLTKEQRDAINDARIMIVFNHSGDLTWMNVGLGLDEIVRQYDAEHGKPEPEQEG